MVARGYPGRYHAKTSLRTQVNLETQRTSNRRRLCFDRRSGRIVVCI